MSICVSVSVSVSECAHTHTCSIYKVLAQLPSDAESGMAGMGVHRQPCLESGRISGATVWGFSASVRFFPPEALARLRGDKTERCMWPIKAGPVPGCLSCSRGCFMCKLCQYK